MVAITVILAAVIAAFVFGMAGNIGQPHFLAFEAMRLNDTRVSLTNLGSPDAGALAAITIIFDDTDIRQDMPLYTGASKSYTPVIPGKNRVVVIAGWSDDSSTVVLDKVV